MEMKRFIVYIVLLLGITGCGTFVYERQITGYYYLIAIDSMEDLAVCYHNASDIYADIGDMVCMKWATMSISSSQRNTRKCRERDGTAFSIILSVTAKSQVKRI
jgi:hypothetical protein